MVYFGFGETFQKLTVELMAGNNDWDAILAQAEAEGLCLIFRAADQYEDHRWDIDELDRLAWELEQVIATNGSPKARDFAEHWKDLVGRARERQEPVFAYSQ